MWTAKDAAVSMLCPRVRFKRFRHASHNVLVAWPKPKDLRNAVAEAKDAATPQAEPLAPVPRVENVLLANEGCQIATGAGVERGEDLGSHFGLDLRKGHLVLVAFRSVLAGNGPTGNQHDKCVTATGCGRRIDARRHIDIETRLRGHLAVVKDLVKGRAVVLGEKDVVHPELRHNLAEAPVEGDRAARLLFVLKALGIRGWREQGIVLWGTSVGFRLVGQYTGTNVYVLPTSIFDSPSRRGLHC